MDEKTKADKLIQFGALIDTFNTHLSDYKSNYDESNTRTDFIDKLFALLGWDMDNSAGYSEDFRDVVREDKVKVEGKTKAPDYSFRIGGTRQFFVEAKQPNVNLKDNPEPACQVRRYGYSAKCPISILTDFEEFAIYDTSLKPGPDDKAGTARIEFFTYKQYIEKFDFLYNTFSPEAIKKGSLKKFIKEDKKGTSSVDSDFLNSLSSWRILLAESIAKKNPSLDEIDLNKAVQKIMNRLVFIRFAEDRGTSVYGELKKITELKNGRIDALRALFDAARTQYNSDLFASDELINGIEIEDSVLKEIILNFYVPKSPYQFDVFPIELLGTIYERFLGQTITLGSRHKAVIEDKPETRKAGGVYYTPAYIVEYIVQNTLGTLLEGKTPEDIQTLSVADPACGSGSFLIKVYDTLLRWYLEYYSKDAKKHIKAKRLVDAGGGYKLTVHEKQNILLRHIYGVDLDSQAVEVSKLSLMLKLMEGEEPLDNAGLSFTYLPNLEHNIKHGNSLVGPDYLLNVQAELFDKKEQYKIKVFDWEKEFPEIFKRGGFDCVVGNPPYIFARNQMFTSEQKEYYYKKFPICNYQLNTYLMFIEKAYKLVHPKGLAGYIVPNNCLTISSFDTFRRFIIDNTQHLHIINSYDKVFAGASVDTCILIFGKEGKKQHIIGELREGKFTSAEGDFTEKLTKSYMIHTSQIIDADNPIHGIIDTLSLNSKPLSDFCIVKSGLKAYQVGKGVPIQTSKIKEDRIFHADSKKDNSFHKYLQGDNVSRYIISWSGEWLSYGTWLAEPRPSAVFIGSRILVRQIPNKLPYCIHAIYTEENYLNDINSMIVFDFKEYAPLFILGVLNSRAVSFWFAHYFGKLSRGIFPQFKVNELEQFPIPALDLSKKAQKAQHDTLCEKVQQMLDFHKRLHAAPKPEKPTLKMQIAAIDRQIDAIVYKLYGLDEGEIRTVEGEG